MNELLQKLLGVVVFFYVLVALPPRGSSTTTTWQTLNGGAPLVVARGGFSGMFPDSSDFAYKLALSSSLPNTVLWCDVQLTKDNVGICFPDPNLINASSVSSLTSHKNSKTYVVNGQSVEGWFTVDLTIKDLTNVTLAQGIYSRSPAFDGYFSILPVEYVLKTYKPAGFWLNIQHDEFFTQHNLSMRSFLLSVSKSTVVNYISSPEVNFLRSITTRFNSNVTKLIFRFMGHSDIEPSTNQTYGSLLRNLTFIKTFSSGVLVPKSYIWPIRRDNYLLPHTTLVSDAHKKGLEVFASDFANDNTLSYNYSYDPVAEFLSFIDNGIFSVDGLVSDFPRTPSATIDCFSHIGSNGTRQAKPVIISNNGASGDYPECTDVAYTAAIKDGADIIDCQVQMTKDNIPICMPSIDLIEGTTIAHSSFSNLSRIIPEISSNPGVFTFDVTWSNIQSLKPQISNPYGQEYHLYRNPAYSNTGQFVDLAKFLGTAEKATSLLGVLIKIENAATFAEQGISVTDAVLDSLSKSGVETQSSLKIMIQSTDSSVLKKFAKKPYELVYDVDEDVQDILNSTMQDIKSFAHSVAVNKYSIFSEREAFITTGTHVVQKLKAFNLSVYVHRFRNEFVSQPWDFLTDATVEINTYVQDYGIDGIITDFPKTAASYIRNRCLGMGNHTPSYMQPIPTGYAHGLAGLVQVAQEPAEAPLPVLTDSEVDQPPLPPVTSRTSVSSTNRSAAAPPPMSSSAQRSFGSYIFFSTLAIMFQCIKNSHIL